MERDQKVKTSAKWEKGQHGTTGCMYFIISVYMLGFVSFLILFYIDVYIV